MTSLSESLNVSDGAQHAAQMWVHRVVLVSV